MIKYFVVLIVFGMSLSHAEVDCVADEQAQCVVTQSSEQEWQITRTIDLKPTIKSFKKLLAKQLNKKDCEKKVFIKSASMKSNGEALKIKVRARLTRLYCTRRARQQVYEKTDDLNFTIIPKIENNQLVFIDKNSNEDQQAFETSFTDVLSKNVKKKLSKVLIHLFKADLSHLVIKNESIDLASLEYQSVKLLKDNHLQIVVSAKSQ